MAYPNKRITTIDCLNPRANLLPSDDVPPASDNRSPSGNTQDLTAPKDLPKLKRKRRADLENLASQRPRDSSALKDLAKSTRERRADRKRSKSKGPGIRHSQRAESPLQNDLRPSSLPTPKRTNRRKGSVTSISNQNKYSNVDGVEDTPTSESRGQNLSRPGNQERTSSVVKEGSPWQTYDRYYVLRVGGNVTVAKMKCPVSKEAEVVAIRELSGSRGNDRLSMLFQIQGEYFVKCAEAYEYEGGLHIVLEHMPISLTEVVAAPVHPTETHMAAIVGQVLSGIQFLESKNMVHGRINCSTILLNDNGQVKIGMQEHCRATSQGDSIDHTDVRAIKQIMIQLRGKPEEDKGFIDANHPHRWSSIAKEFWSTIPSASAEKLLQHTFLGEWKKDDLLLLISFTQVSSRRFYTVGL